MGIEPNGLIALYRGLPYDGPFGLELYEEVAVTSVPARSIRADRREAILDHELRSREDASDLVAQLEQGRNPLTAPLLAAPRMSLAEGLAEPAGRRTRAKGPGSAR